MTSRRQRDESTSTRQRRRAAQAARRHLRQVDPRLRRLIDQIGPHRPQITPDPFRALLGSIIHQQVSMNAAAAIQRRVRDLCPRGRPTPTTLLALRENQLRGAGLSRQKVKYVRNVATEFAARRLTAAKLVAWSDEEVIAATMRIKGVGRWTAEMLLIFCLERPDVWPVDDFGLRKAVRGLLGLKDLPAAATLHELAEPWRPYRSYATWYLWRSLDGPLMPGIAP